MIFDNYDYELMKLIGLCRYMPTGLQRRYDSPCFSKQVISKLQVLGFVKMQSDKLSYKLTKRGRQVLADMGHQFPEDARMNLKRASYRRKLKSAHWNVLLHLAGIDVYFQNARELSETRCGYVSSLILRSDMNMKALAGTKFLGVLKIEDTAYVPYHLENETEWIIPGYEMEIYSSQVAAMRGIKNINLILTGETLEELWSYIHPENESEKLTRGMKRFDRALEEMGSEYLLLPFGRDGVIQASLLRIEGSHARIAKAIGCEIKHMPNLSECDGMIDGVPCIIAIDFNVKRIVKALKQVEQVNAGIVPRICCMQFQKSTLFKLLRFYGCQKTMVIAVDRYEIGGVFPELNHEPERDAYRTNGGKCIEVV